MKGEIQSSMMQFPSKNIDELVEQMMPLLSRVESDHSRGVAVYGAGFVGTWAARYLSSIGAKVTHFVDRDPKKNGTSIEGIPVVLPTDPVVSSITSMYIAARHAVTEVNKAMATYGRNLISFDGYFVAKNYKRFANVRDNYFSDCKSIDTYNALLQAMLTGSTASCLAVMEKDMYFGLPQFSGNFEEIFVDAGAFVGDTVERFIWENLGTFKHLYAFEPGHVQFQALQKRMDRLYGEWAIDQDRVSLVRAGLGSETNRMAFSFVYDSPLRHGLSNCDIEVATSTSESIEVFPLDSFLDGKPVTFIKADVEGMEMALLRGAQATICRNKPKMALCVYHYPSDLYEVAEFVKSLVPEYKFSIRQHAPLFGDFVLYCYLEQS